MQTTFDHHANNFDFMRLFLAILVIFSHSYPLGTGTEIYEPFNVLTRGQATGGHIAVDLFFIMSGFLITASFERTPSVGLYLKKRAYRIYPGFILAMLVGVLVVLPVSGGYLPGLSKWAQAMDFITQTARLQEFHYAGAFSILPVPEAINGSVWSIQYEFWCYIGVILLGISGALRSVRMLVCLFVLSIATSYLFAVHGWTPGGDILGQVFGYPPFWARLLPMYLAGVVFYRLRPHLVIKARWIALACCLLAAAALVPHGWPLVFPIAGPYLMLVFVFHPGIRLHGTARFGDFSYGTYLYAFPVQQMIMHGIRHLVSPWELFGLATPVTLGCAAVSWYGVERHLLKRRPSGDKAGVRGAYQSSHGNKHVL